VLALIVRRLLTVVPLLLVVSFGVFCLILFVPGDPAVTLAGGGQATEEQIEQVRQQLGLDDPFLVRYLRWLGDAVTLDFGNSLVEQADVGAEIRQRLPVTMSLALAALAVTVLVGLPAGVLAGIRPGSWIDRVVMLGTTVGLAIPGFWLAMLMIVLFGVELAWFPTFGWTSFSESPLQWLRHVTLPAIALGAASAASFARQLRAALVDTMSSAYVRTAWAKGAGTVRVVGKHALKNAAIPAVTVLGLQLGTLLGGSVIAEQIFGIQGLGTYLVGGIFGGDFPVIQGVTVVFVLIYVLVNLLVDLAYGFLNPKVRIS
jgi:peptide/nickel transport system permease protein